MVNNNLTRRVMQFENSLTHAFRRKGINGKLEPFVRASRYIVADVRLANPMDLKAALGLSEQLAYLSGSRFVSSIRQGGFVRYSFDLEKSHWINYTRNDVSGMEIGIGAGGLKIEFNFDNYHHLFAGATKSGKSTTIQGVLYALATENKPQDLGIYIIDPHGDYVGFDGLAHLECGVARTKQEILNTWRLVANEYEKRKAENNRNGKRIVVVSDECQDSLNIGDKKGGINIEQAGIFASLSAGSGKYRIHLIAGSQKPTQADLAGINNLVGRYVGRVEKRATAAHLSGQSNIPANMLSGYGDFLKIGDMGSVTRFVSAVVLPQHYDNLPRAEIVKVPDVILNDSNEEPEKSLEKAGRPQKCLDPIIAGRMLALGIAGRRVARKELDLKQQMHTRYRDFLKAMLREMIRYKKEKIIS